MRFLPREVTYRSKTTFFPDRHEPINPRPAVKGGAQGIWFQNPIELPKCREEPIIGIVSDASAAVAWNIIHEIRRIGENEVDALRRHRSHFGNAVGMNDTV